MPSYTTNFNWIKPTIGADGDTWGNYLDTNLDSQDSLVRKSINNFISATPPTEAQAGTIWVDNTTDPWVMKFYDGTDWIIMGNFNTSSNTFSVASSGIYVGDMKFSTQAANHGGWLLCNGAAVSTTTYSGLFAQIGYAFGGSGSTFNLPDLRGRVAGAIGTGTGLSTRTLGQTVGAETHTLTSAELPNPLTSTTAVANFTITSGVNGVQSSTGGGLGGTGPMSNIGGGNSHNNMQPTLFVGNYFIYSGV